MKSIMKSGIIIAIALAFASCAQTEVQMANEDQEAIRKEVNQAFDGLVAAVKKIDVEEYLGFFDKDRFTSLNENGTVTHTFAEFQEDFRSQFGTVKGYESLKFEKVKITVINRETAVLVNQYDTRVILKFGNTIDASGAGLQVWSKNSGEWKLVSISSSAK